MKVLRFFGKFIGVLYSICFTIILFIFTILFFTTNFLKADYYKSIFNSIDLANLNLVEIGIDLDVKTLIEDTLDEIGVDKEHATRIIENEELKNKVGDILGNYVNYITTGDNMPQITNEDIKEILENEEIKPLVEGKIDEKEIEEIVTMINNSIKESKNIEELLNENDDINDLMQSKEGVINE